jgi:hypothetical protein
MKYKEALQIIKDSTKNQGFMVSFEKVKEGILTSDYFPDKHNGEDLLPSEEAAWDLALKFARATRNKCVNIYVIDHDFSPVEGYRENIIKNR